VAWQAPSAISGAAALLIGLIVTDVRDVSLLQDRLYFAMALFGCQHECRRAFLVKEFPVCSGFDECSDNFQMAIDRLMQRCPSFPVGQAIAASSRKSFCALRIGSLSQGQLGDAGITIHRRPVQRGVTAPVARVAGLDVNHVEGAPRRTIGPKGDSDAL
jgi:hypothetical protein